MKALLGTKIGMSQTFSETGDVVPVTLVHVVPNSVSLRRDESKDGYSAIQLTLNRQQNTKSKTQNLNTGISREFKGEMAEDVKEVAGDIFEPGDLVEVSGVSKGKGFQGVVKRHGFAGGPASHGHRHVLRAPGSIGSRFPQHVRKGKRMAGRMGSDRVTVKNLQVVSVDTKNHVLAIKGAVPGRKGTVLEIRGVEPKKDKS